MKFDEWYEKHKEALCQLKTRQEISFYVWTNKPAKTSAKTEGGYTEQFEIFWNLYPKKIGKGGAYAVWKTIAKNNDAQSQLGIACAIALKWQCEQQNWKNENGKYIPNPETYLRNRRWEDEAPRSASESGDEANYEEYTDMDGVKRRRKK